MAERIGEKTGGQRLIDFVAQRIQHNPSVDGPDIRLGSREGEIVQDQDDVVLGIDGVSIEALDTTTEGIVYVVSLTKDGYDAYSLQAALDSGRIIEELSVDWEALVIELEPGETLEPFPPTTVEISDGHQAAAELVGVLEHAEKEGTIVWD